jgi:hypothetical protein
VIETGCIAWQREGHRIKNRIEHLNTSTSMPWRETRTLAWQSRHPVLALAMVCRHRKSSSLKTTTIGPCILVVGLVLLMSMNVNAHQISASAVAIKSAAAAKAFLAALSSQQRKMAMFEFDDPQRYDWHYVPRRRAGLAFKDMSDSQRSLARAFLKTGLSEEGYDKADLIFRLETVLAEIEFGNFMGRDPQKYYFSFFGRPSETGTWGWRVEGHHLSLNVTIVDGHLFADTPRFWGANPAKVHSGHGNLSGVRALAKEEDAARALLRSLNDAQLKSVVFSPKAYRDIVSGTAEVVAPLEPVGIAASELSSRQRELLNHIIEAYLSSLPPEIARQRLDVITRDEPERICFGWAGGLEPGQPHYYRIQGSRFLIEYDNVQNGANHIHTVWRDFDGDFGRDLLREHYLADHH